MPNTDYEWFESYEDTIDQYFEGLDEDEPDEGDDPFLECGFDPYLGCYTDDC